MKSPIQIKNEKERDEEQGRGGEREMKSIIEAPVT
jgi:hypothetical protein